MSTVRLVSAGGLHDGRYEAGVDLTMAPGSHTYWKIPGEAGVPPVFAFNGSENVATATVSYPVPSRISEEGIDAFGYDNGVVFPVKVVPNDRSKPSVLHLDMTYAVCNKICVPGHSEATLKLTPQGGATGGDDVAKALAKVPRAIASAPELTISPGSGKSGSGKSDANKPNSVKSDPRSIGASAADPSTFDPNDTNPTWTATWNGANPPADIFPAAPEGFFFDSKKTSPTTWTIVAQRSVTAPKSPKVAVTLILARPKDPTSVSETFDVGAQSK